MHVCSVCVKANSMRTAWDETHEIIIKLRFINLSFVTSVLSQEWRTPALLSLERLLFLNGSQKQLRVQWRCRSDLLTSESHALQLHVSDALPLALRVLVWRREQLPLGEGCVESRAVWRRGPDPEALWGSEPGVGEIRGHLVRRVLLRVAGGPHLDIGSPAGVKGQSTTRPFRPKPAGPLLPWALSRRTGVFRASVVGVQTLDTITQALWLKE